MSAPDSFGAGDPFALPWEREAIVQDIIANDTATAYGDVPEQPTIANDIKRHTVKLATLRVELAAREATIKAARQELELRLGDQLRLLEGLRREVMTTEDTVRELSVLEYQRSGTKRPSAGVEIKVSKRLEYDRAAAWAWAQETRLCVTPAQLDEAAFEKIAKATELPFVAVREEPKVTIAKDLLAALEGHA